MKKSFLMFWLVLMLAFVSSAATIGNTNSGTSTDVIAQAINAARFIAPTNMTVGTLNARVTGSGGKYKTAVYTGSATVPSNFLAGSTEVTAPTNGWYSFALSKSVTLTNGQNYWFAIWSDNNNSFVYYTTGGTLRWITTSTYSNTWPNPLVTDGGTTFNYCIYASDNLTNAPAPTVRPSFVTQPTNQTNLFGSNVVFNTSVAGTTPMSYQWYFSGYTNKVTGTNSMGGPITVKTNLPFVAINGARTNTLTRLVTTTNLGNYFLSVTNVAGSTNSSVVTLGNTNIPPSPYTQFVFRWTNSPNVTKFELWSTKDLMQPFTLLTNVGLATNYTLTYYKTNMPSQQFFKLLAYTGGGTIKTNQSVTLAWDASPDASVTGYRIYYGTASANYTNSAPVGNVLTATITNLGIGVTYYFAAVAYDALGVESVFSNEASYTPPTNIVSTVSATNMWPVNLTVIQ